MSSIMRARNALPGRGEEAEVIGGPLRAEGCWTFNARDQMPRSSPLTAHPLTATAKNAPASTPPSRESGFVPCPIADLRICRWPEPALLLGEPVCQHVDEGAHLGAQMPAMGIERVDFQLLRPVA